VKLLLKVHDSRSFASVCLSVKFLWCSGLSNYCSIPLGRLIKVLTTEKKQKQLQAMRMSEPVRLGAITTDSEAESHDSLLRGFSIPSRDIIITIFFFIKN